MTYGKVIAPIIGVMLLVGGIFFYNAQKDEEILIIAHRGASAYAPEHSMAAYERAIELEADFIELDLQMTKDNVVVAFHDSNLSNWTQEDKEIADYTFEELKKIDIGKIFNDKNKNYANDDWIGQRILSVEEIFTQFSDSVNYYIEIKKPNMGIENSLGESLKKHNLYKNPNTKVIIQSFHLESLDYFHEHYPQLDTVYLIEELTDKEILKSLPFQINGIGINHLNLNQETIKQIKRKGLYIHAYTVNEKETVEFLIKNGISGIFTDYPDILEQ